jgi:hypothetical protein
VGGTVRTNWVGLEKMHMNRSPACVYNRMDATNEQRTRLRLQLGTKLHKNIWLLKNLLIGTTFCERAAVSSHKNCWDWEINDGFSNFVERIHQKLFPSFINAIFVDRKEH